MSICLSHFEINESLTGRGKSSDTLATVDVSFSGLFESFKTCFSPLTCCLIISLSC